MALITVLQLLLCSFLVRLGHGSSITSVAQPSQPIVSLADASIVSSSYRSIFSSLTIPHHGPRSPFGGGLFCNPCPNGDGGCTDCMGPMNVKAEKTSLVDMAHDRLRPTPIMQAAVVPSALADVVIHDSVLYTAETSPSRTTIYRAPSTHIPLVEAADADKTPHLEELEFPLGVLEQDPTEITQWYYSYSLDGHNPSTIAIIVEDGQGNPVTLLSFAKTLYMANLISADLVEQLNLTHRISTVSSSPSLDQYGDFESISNQIASISGVLSLNVIAGRHDTQIVDAEFLVFKPATDPSLVKPGYRGRYQPDLYVGVDFLYRAGALKVSDDFANVAANKELGVVVQRVFDSITAPKGQLKKEIHHGEL